MKNKRGQASIEFLFTYGWAIMAITISIGTLLYFNVLTPDKFVSQYCDVGSQFECIEVGLYENGTITMYIRNNHRVDIELNNITFASNTVNHFHDLENLRINRGETVNFDIDLETTFFQGDTQRLRLEVFYNRIGGSNNYYFTGAIFTGVLTN